MHLWPDGEDPPIGSVRVLQVGGGCAVAISGPAAETVRVLLYTHRIGRCRLRRVRRRAARRVGPSRCTRLRCICWKSLGLALRYVGGEANPVSPRRRPGWMTAACSSSYVPVSPEGGFDDEGVISIEGDDLLPFHLHAADPRTGDAWLSFVRFSRPDRRHRTVGRPEIHGRGCAGLARDRRRGPVGLDGEADGVLLGPRNLRRPRPGWPSPGGVELAYPPAAFLRIDCFVRARIADRCRQPGASSRLACLALASARWLAALGFAVEGRAKKFSPEARDLRWGRWQHDWHRNCMLVGAIYGDRWAVGDGRQRGGLRRRASTRTG